MGDKKDWNEKLKKIKLDFEAGLVHLLHKLLFISLSGVQ